MQIEERPNLERDPAGGDGEGIYADREIILPLAERSQIPGLWICLRLLRQHGSRLKVKVVVDLATPWLKAVEHLLAGEKGVVLVTVSCPRQLPAGENWLLSVQALLESEARYSLILDPQTVPLKAPEYLFEQAAFIEHGLLFWPRFAPSAMRVRLHRNLRLRLRAAPEVDGACWMIEGPRHRDLLHQALALAGGEEMGALLWGNYADTLQLACVMAQRGFAGVEERPLPLFVMDKEVGLYLAGLCHFDLEGEQIFQNRIREPWRLSINRSIGGGLFEPQCWQFLQQLKEHWLPSLFRKADAFPQEFTGQWLMDWTQRHLPTAEEEFEQCGILRDRSADPHYGIDLDQWTFLWLREDGVVDTHWEMQVDFWAYDIHTGHLRLLGADGELLATLRPLAGGVWAGEWVESGRACRIARQTALLETRSLAALAGSEVSGRSGISARKPMHLVSKETSLADAVSMVLCACAWAEAGFEVVLHTHAAPWFHRIDHPGLAITYPYALHEDTVEPRRGDYAIPAFCLLHPNQSVFLLNRIGPADAKSRGSMEGLQPAMPRYVDIAIRQKRLDFLRYVVIVPYSDRAGRDWPVAHWHRLIELLRRQGVDVVAVGDSDEQAEKFTKEFARSHAFWAAGDSPEWMIDVLAGAEALIAPDGGLAQLAALHGFRTLCLVSEYSQSYFYSGLNIQAIGGSAPCKECWHSPERGYQPLCRFFCPALGMISPEEVLQAFLHPANSPEKTAAL